MLGQTTTPHDVLNDIIARNLTKYRLVAKPAEMFARTSKSAALIKQLNFVLVNLWASLKSPNDKKVFREFDNFSLLFMLLPPRDLIFNVNHNLTTKFGRIVTKLLSTRFRILFIDPSPDLIARYPYLMKASSGFTGATGVRWQGRDVLLICGNRNDQKSLSDEQLVALTDRLRVGGFAVQVVGRNHPQGVRLSDEEYMRAARRSACICTSTYTDRHAGTLWYLVERAPILLYRWTNVAEEQVKGHSLSIPFTSIEEVIDKLSALAVELLDDYQTSDPMDAAFTASMEKP